MHDGVIALDARVRVDARPAGRRRALRDRALPGRAGARPIDWHGEAIVLRPIRPEDEPQHRAFVEQLAPEDLRLRFF